MLYMSSCKMLTPYRLLYICSLQDADTIGIEGSSMQTWEGVGFAGFGGSFGPG